MARPTRATARGAPADGGGERAAGPVVAGGVPIGAGERAAGPVVAGGVPIGAGTFTLIAGAPATGGPADGSLELLLEAARLALQARATLLDVGRAWESLGVKAVEACRRASGLAPVCAVLAPGEVAAVAEVAAMLRLPSTALDSGLPPSALGAAGPPVLLERGGGASVRAWLLAAERIEREGGARVVLCDPGDDLAAVPSLRGEGGRPLVVDTAAARDGHRSAGATARAAAAVGADGVSVAVDGGLDGLWSELDAVAAAVGRRMAGRRIRYVGGQGAEGRPAGPSRRWPGR